MYSKDEIKEIIKLLDTHNFMCCNSVAFAKLITEIKCVLEDILEELSNAKQS